jgi:hypothetical protein
MVARPLQTPTLLIFFNCSLGVLGLCWAGPARAEDKPCTSPRIHLELEGKPEWEAEVPDLRTRLLALEHVDACAHVTIRAQGDGVLVSVTSQGRAATRFLTNPSELAHTVEALVVLPPPAAQADEPEPVETPKRQEPAPTPPAPTTHMELGAAASGRIAGGPLLGGGGIATSAGLVDHGWLIGVSARWEFAADYFSAITPNGFSMGSGAVGVELGHRWNIRAMNLDALIGPTAVLESQEAFGSVTSPSGIEGSALDVRLNLKLRASLPSTSRFRFYAAIDAEASPHRLVSPKRLDPELPTLPFWSAGVALGVLWEVR